MENILKAGTNIRCSRKRHNIGVTVSDVDVNGAIMFSSIIFAPGQERIAGEPYRCKICDSLYVMQGKVHTSDGWFPAAPLIEPVSIK